MYANPLSEKEWADFYNVPMLECPYTFAEQSTEHNSLNLIEITELITILLYKFLSHKCIFS
jgi:hypothetical protein